LVVVTRRGRSRSCDAAFGEFELADVAVGEREFIAQCGDLFAQPLVVVERGAQPGADRFVARMLARVPGRRRSGFAAEAFDLCA